MTYSNFLYQMLSLLIGIVIVMNQLIADTISQFNLQEKNCAKACILYIAFIIYTHWYACHQMPLTPSNCHHFIAFYLTAAISFSVV